MGSWMLFVLGGLAVIIVVYNRISLLLQRRRTAFADIDVHFEKRYETIPDLIAFLKPRFGTDYDLFKKIDAARTATKDAYGVGDARFKAEAGLGKALKDLFVAADANPDLKSDEKFVIFRRDFSDLETKISETVAIFNAVTAEYNSSIRQFPGTLMAKLFHYVEEPSFETEN